jgi:hypothetical protein
MRIDRAITPEENSGSLWKEIKQLLAVQSMAPPHGTRNQKLQQLSFGKYMSKRWQLIKQIASDKSHCYPSSYWVLPRL